MATAHIRQLGDDEVIAVVIDGASMAEVKAMMNAAIAGTSPVLTVMDPGTGFVRIEKSKIKNILYTS